MTINSCIWKRKCSSVATNPVPAESHELSIPSSFVVSPTGIGTNESFSYRRIYNRFMEGFDTVDLRDAKAPLEQLSAQPSTE
jgi:hypothetical protein